MRYITSIILFVVLMQRPRTAQQWPRLILPACLRINIYLWINIPLLTLVFTLSMQLGTRGRGFVPIIALVTNLGRYLLDNVLRYASLLQQRPAAGHLMKVGR